MIGHSACKNCQESVQICLYIPETATSISQYGQTPVLTFNIEVIKLTPPFEEIIA